MFCVWTGFFFYFFFLLWRGTWVRLIGIRIAIICGRKPFAGQILKNSEKEIMRWRLDCSQVGKCLGSQWMNFRVLKVILCRRCWILCISPAFPLSRSLYFLAKINYYKTPNKSVPRTIRTQILAVVSVCVCECVSFLFVYNFKLKRRKAFCALKWTL